MSIGLTIGLAYEPQLWPSLIWHGRSFEKTNHLDSDMARYSVGHTDEGEYRHPVPSPA